MKELLFDWQGKKLFYRDLGSGPCLVLLHGFPFDGRIWLPFASHLASSFRLIIPDLPGFGKSERPETQLNMNVMAWAVSALLQHLKTGPCVVVGHSMGGYVALAMSRERMTPNLKALVLFHSQAGADDTPTQSKRNESIALIKEDKEAFLEAFLPGLFGKTIPKLAAEHAKIARSQSAETMASAMAGLRDRVDHTLWLGEAEIPLLFILGKADIRMPTDHILKQVSYVPHAELLLLANVGHMGFAEADEVIAPVLRDFAGRCLKGA